MLAPILRVMRSRWALTGLGVASCGAMIWLFGPFLGALGGVMPRAAALVLLAMVWAAANATIDQMRRRADRALAGGVAGTAGGPSTAEKEEVLELRERLDRAMALLRRARGTRGYLYEQPWYVIIGPPGAGKTTALANSGLKFPLAAELGQSELRGVGGTRLCDWSFTDAAVLIDTAGRYTTQDSNAAVDRAGWEGFLDLLRRTRKQQPLNGVIVAVALGDIVSASDGERLAHARAIRSRIRELNTKLGIRLPVYVIFTKADLIRGFAEFFDGMDRTARGQVWGMTFPLTNDDFGPVGQFAAEYRSLVAQLSARLVDRLQDERSLERRALIVGFPSEVASMEAPLGSFVEEAFGGTRLDPAPLLRGVYLASATQQGSPIDRLSASLAHGFGLDQRQVDGGSPRQGRSYFLERLLKDVVFGEAMLVTRNSAATRRWLLVRGAAWGVCGVLVVGCIGWLLFAAWQSAAAVSAYDTALSAYGAEYKRLVADQPLDPVPLAGADLMQVLPLLDRARAVVDAAAKDHASFGLSQQEKLERPTKELYGRALEYVLLPRLVSLMEARMRAPSADTNYLYHAIGPYKMLCCGLTMDAPAAHAWLANDLDAHFGGSNLAKQRADLLVHADALFAHDRAFFPAGMNEVSHDPALVASAEAKIGHMSVSDVAYALIRGRPLPQDVADFVPERAAGALARTRFTRRSGAGLDMPISGFFTPAGFREVLLARLPEATDRAIRESVVRGEGAAINPNDTAKRQQIERDVIRAYTDDYIAAWDGFLNDLDVVPPSDSGAAVGDYSTLTSETGPIMRLLGAVISELSLAPPSKTTGGATASGATASGTAAKDVPPDDPSLSGGAVDKHFADLRDYVSNGGLATHLKILGQIEAQLERSLVSGAVGAPPAAPAGAYNLDRAFAGAPQPAGRWLADLAKRGRVVESVAQRQQAADAFSVEGGAQAQCRRVTRNFPFRRNGPDASMEDFAALFAKEGTLDSFFTQYLRPYVSTGPGPWHVQHAAGDVAAPPVDNAAVSSFQNASEIREAFFGFGGSAPEIRFALKPAEFGDGTAKVTLDFGGIRRSFAAGDPAETETLEWPGPTGMASARVTFEPAGDGPPLEGTGTWALFRLLRAARLQATGNEHALRVTFAQGSRHVTFDLTTQAPRNPFRPSLFENFVCPELRR